MEIFTVLAVVAAGSAVLTLVVWGMDAGRRAGDAADDEPEAPSGVPGIATGHHRSTEPGGAA